MAGIQILGFSPRVYEAVQGFFSGHPVIEMEESREYDETSPPVLITEMRCMECGYRIIPKMALPALSQPYPADMLRATRWRHAWDQQSRARYCGGTIFFVTEPA